MISPRWPHDFPKGQHNAGSNSLTLPGLFAARFLKRQARSRTAPGCARPSRRSRQDPLFLDGCAQRFGAVDDEPIFAPGWRLAAAQPGEQLPDRSRVFSGPEAIPRTCLWPSRSTPRPRPWRQLPRIRQALGLRLRRTRSQHRAPVKAFCLPGTSQFPPSRRSENNSRQTGTSIAGWMRHLLFPFCSPTIEQEESRPWL